MLGSRLRGFLALLLLPVAAGAFLRLWNLGGQVVLGDEVHGIAAALRWDLATILTTYRETDHCVPLSAYFELLVENGHPLTEWSLRLPSLAAGLLALVALPWVAAPALGRRTALVFGWLVALSPVLVYYSRIARPYAVMVLLGSVAAICFWRYWEAASARGEGPGGMGWAAGYAAAGAGAAWFHPGAGPFVAAPLAWAAAELALRRQRSGRAREDPGARGGAGILHLVTAASLLALGIAAFLVPAAESFFQVLRAKAGSDPPNLTTWRGVFHILAGSGSPWAVAGFWSLTVFGFVVQWRSRRRLAVYTAVLAGAALAALMVVQPHAVASSVVASRYLLVALPFVLLWAASGLVALAERSPERPLTRACRWGIAVVLVGSWIVAHPYRVDPELRLGPFAGSIAAVAYERALPVLPPEAVPEVYRLMAREPGSGAVIGSTSDIVSRSMNLDLSLWRAHRRPVILAISAPWVDDPGVALATLVSDRRPHRITATSARFLALQLDRPDLWRIQEEIRTGGRHRGVLTETQTWRAKRAQVLDRILTRAWGPAHFNGPAVRVWDLRRVREAPERPPQ